MFAGGGALHPDRPLLIEGGMVMTRAEVERATAVLSDAMLQLVRPGQLIGSLIDRGLEAALLLLAANQAGVPITFFDRSLPENEWRRVIEGADCALLVTTPAGAALADRLGSGRIRAWVVRPNQWALLPAPSTRSVRVDEDAPGIVVFSSGTTGDPKGVVRSVATLRIAGDNCQARHNLSAGDVIGDLASFRFVTSSGTTYGAVRSGAAVSFHDPDGDGLAGVAEWAVRTGVTVMRLQAALMRTLVELGTDLRGSRVRSVSLAGETLFGTELMRLRLLLPANCDILCVYGSSEGGGIAQTRFPAGTAIPAGRIRFPRPSHVRIVDENLEVIPAGDVGEIVTTEQQSAGYWNKPALTSERYLLRDDGSVLYRTGDLGRISDGDTLEVLGRSDSQVKVRGQNVELSEVEAVLLEHPDVRTAAVVDVPRPGGGTSMIAFFTPVAGKLPATAVLRRHLSERLPAYKIPARFVVLDHLPTTPAGKIDRSRLRTTSGIDTDREIREPRTLVESGLVEQMRRLLGTEELGIDDDFFEMGGDSLSAIEFAVWVSRSFGVTLSTTALIAHPTMASLAQQIDRQGARQETTIGILRHEEHPVASLVLVAGGGDSIVSQRPLSKAIRSDLRIIGVQGRGIDDRRRTENSVTAYAARAVRELLVLDPTGPYVLGGHSFGGIVAQEMARQLELLERSVLAVAVIDTVAPADRRPPGFLRSALRRARGWGEEIRDRRLMFGVRHDRRESLRIRKGIVFATHVRALSSYVARPCRAPILVIRADSGTNGSEQQRFGRWAELTTGGLTVVSTPGTHVSVKDVPYVGGVAAHIDALIDEILVCSVFP